MLVSQLESKASVIVLESGPTFFGRYQMVFERCLENNIEEQMISSIYDDGGHRFWLQRPLNLLTKEQRVNYITAILEYFYIFLNF